MQRACPHNQDNDATQFARNKKLHWHATNQQIPQNCTCASGPTTTHAEPRKGFVF